MKRKAVLFVFAIVLILGVAGCDINGTHVDDDIDEALPHYSVK